MILSHCFKRRNFQHANILEHTQPFFALIASAVEKAVQTGVYQSSTAIHAYIPLRHELRKYLVGGPVLRPYLHGREVGVSE